MRVFFIYPNLTRQKYIQLGIAYLSAMLKRGGHEVALFDTTWGFDEQELKRGIEGFDPQLIGISARSMDFEYATNVARLLKDHFDIPIAFGGAHPTVAPEETITGNEVDMICIGEGEEALLELVDRMDRNEDYYDVSNFWFKRDGELIRNPLRAPIQNLDDLAYPDRELFNPKHLTSYLGMIFITSRGCPFRCSYCINDRLRLLYRDKGKLVRLRTIEDVIAEIEETRTVYDFDSIYFADEAFTMNRERTKRFCDVYGREVRIPFGIMTRADLLDEEICRALAEAGCRSIGIGIESGNDHLRNAVLKRRMDKKTIISAFNSAKEAGIITYSFNMVGIPGETEETIMETIELNRVVRSDVVQATIFAPLHGTALRDVCEREGYMRQEPLGGYYSRTFIELPTISPGSVEAFHGMFWLYCSLPRFTFPVLHLARLVLERLPPPARWLVGKMLLNLGRSWGSIRISGWEQTIRQIWAKEID